MTDRNKSIAGEPLLLDTQDRPTIPAPFQPLGTPDRYETDESFETNPWGGRIVVGLFIALILVGMVGEYLDSSLFFILSR